MAQSITQYWQIIVYVITAAVGVGITLASVRSAEDRISRIESVGTAVAQGAAKHGEELERRMRLLEAESALTQQLLHRIDERTKAIAVRLERMEK